MSIGTTAKNYPVSIDTFSTWQDDIDAIYCHIVNDIQDQLIAIENELGANPSGSLSSLVARLNVSMNSDGTIKQVFIDSSDNVGIGTNVDSTQAQSRAWGIGGDGYAWGDFAILSSSTNNNTFSTVRFLITNAGYVGIGTTSPSTNLHVIGSTRISSLAGSLNRAVYSDANGVLTNTASDATMKQDVEILSYGLQHILLLRPVSYKWKIDLQDKLGTQKEIGLIAQEVKEIIPEIVGTNSNETLSLDYPKLVVVLINGMKELNKKVEDQQALIENLINEIKSLKN